MCPFPILLALVTGIWTPRLAAQATFQSNAIADTFVGTNGPGYTSPTDVPDRNYGGAGTMQVAPAGSNRGERQAAIRFNSAAAVASFNGIYGLGGWTLSSVSLRLGSNFSIQGSQPNNPIFNPINGGLFEVRWMVDDSWGEGNGTPMSQSTTGGLTFNTLPGFLAAGDISLATPTFVPAAANPSQASYALNLNPGFVSDLSGGNLVSLHLLSTASGGASYLFNTSTFANPNNPALFLTAMPVPEPGSLLIVGIGAAGAAGGVALSRRRRPAPAGI